MATGLALSLAACLIAVSPAAAQEPSPPGPPPVFLVGVVIPESGEAMAIVEDPQTREQTLHTEGAQIGGGVQLTKILKDRVILSSGDVAIEVRLAGSPPPPPRVRVPPRPRPLPPRTRFVVPR